MAIYYTFVEINANGYLMKIFQHHILPFSQYPGVPKHPEFSFYINYLANFGFSPFLFWIPIVLIPLLFSKNAKHKQLLIYLLIVGVVFLIGQSSSLMKNEWYIAPLYPILWLILSLSIFETFIIIKTHFFNKSKYIKIITFIIITGMMYSFGNKYCEVYNKNQARYYGYVYDLERDGKFLNDIKKWNRYINNIIVLSDKPYEELRQLDFYIKKFKYIDNTKVIVQCKINDNLIDNYVLTSNESFVKQINQQFNYEIVYKEQYGYLFYITGKIKKK